MIIHQAEPVSSTASLFGTSSFWKQVNKIHEDWNFITEELTKLGFGSQDSAEQIRSRHEKIDKEISKIGTEDPVENNLPLILNELPDFYNSLLIYVNHRQLQLLKSDFNRQIEALKTKIANFTIAWNLVLILSKIPEILPNFTEKEHAENYFAEILSHIKNHKIKNQTHFDVLWQQAYNMVYAYQTYTTTPSEQNHNRFLNSMYHILIAIDPQIATSSQSTKAVLLFLASFILLAGLIILFATVGEGIHAAGYSVDLFHAGLSAIIHFLQPAGPQDIFYALQLVQDVGIPLVVFFLSTLPALIGSSLWQQRAVNRITNQSPFFKSIHERAETQIQDNESKKNYELTRDSENEEMMNYWVKIDTKIYKASFQPKLGEYQNITIKDETKNFLKETGMAISDLKNFHNSNDSHQYLPITRSIAWKDKRQNTYWQATLQFTYGLQDGTHFLKTAKYTDGKKISSERYEAVQKEQYTSKSPNPKAPNYYQK